MIASLVLRLIALGVPPKAAKILLFTLLILGLIVILGTAKCAYDRSIIDAHDSKVEATTAKADRKADDAAAVQRRMDDARLNQEQGQLEKAQNNAQLNTAVDRNRAYYRCLRLQQDARAHGLQPPACV